MKVPKGNGTVTVRACVCESLMSSTFHHASQTPLATQSHAAVRLLVV